jgi:hypothetical protein
VSTITIRDVPEEAHAILKVMAAEAPQGGRRSVEGLARSLLVDAARRRGPGLGSQLVAIGRQLHATLAEIEGSSEAIELDALFRRSDEPSEPAAFE